MPDPRNPFRGPVPTIRISMLSRRGRLFGDDPPAPTPGREAPPNRSVREGGGTRLNAYPVSVRRRATRKLQTCTTPLYLSTWRAWRAWRFCNRAIYPQNELRFVRHVPMGMPPATGGDNEMHAAAQATPPAHSDALCMPSIRTAPTGVLVSTFTFLVCPRSQPVPGRTARDGRNGR